MRYETNIEGLEILEAKEEHVDDILNLILEIAKYEKMLSEVKATKKSLMESLFIKKRAYVLLAKYHEKIVGYMLYFYNYSTFVGNANLYLEDIFILKEYRHLGIGKTFFKILAEIAKKENCHRIDWVCLNWNEPSLKFYQSMGAKKLDEWVLHRLEGQAIQKLLD